MSYDTILLAVEVGVARLTLNRPDKLNSFNVAMHLEVRDALARVRTDKSARVLVLTGAGRGFCAGQDLADRAVAPGAAPVEGDETVELREIGGLIGHPTEAVMRLQDEGSALAV